MSMPLPGVQSTTITDVLHLVDNTLTVHGTDVVLDSGNTDSGSTPTYRFRPGNVIVKRTSTGRYVEANDSNGDRTAPAAVTSAEAADTDWDGTTITVYVNGDLVDTIVLAGTDDTTAEVVSALNTSFAAENVPCVASGTDGNPVVITLHGTGSLRVESTLATAFSTAGGAGSYAEDTSEDADYRVTDAFADLEIDGTAVNAPVRTLLRGHFDESNLINLTADAKAVLLRRGSIFG